MSYSYARLAATRSAAGTVPGLATARNAIAVILLVGIVMLYVIWTSAGNSDSDTLASGGRFDSDAKGLTRYAYGGIRMQVLREKHGTMFRHLADVPSANESMYICKESLLDTREYIRNRGSAHFSNLPPIYFVTPTYPRREQIPELKRLAYTLMHVPRIHWIVANDYDGCNSYLDTIFEDAGIPFTHISSPMPDIYRSKSPQPRGVANRRAALNLIKKNKLTTGVLYFGDDDNTFDLKLFDEIRTTMKVSMFPVGLIGLYSVSTPVVKEGKVIAFFDSWPAKRKWPVDMAGFAVNLAYLAEHPNATMPYKAGYEEDAFLRSISLRLGDIEAKANNCTEVLVWHTQTQKTKAPMVQLDKEYLGEHSSLGALYKNLQAMGVSYPSNSEGVRAQITKDGSSKPFSFFFR